MRGVCLTMNNIMRMCGRIERVRFPHSKDPRDCVTVSKLGLNGAGTPSLECGILELSTPESHGVSQNGMDRILDVHGIKVYRVSSGKWC